MEEKIKQQGMIYVSAGAWDDLGKPETCEAWKKALLLPDAYDIESVDKSRKQYGDYTLRNGDVYTLYVRHEDIPEVVGASLLPEVVPVYRRNDNKQVMLQYIEMRKYYDDDWHVVAVQEYERSEV